MISFSSSLSSGLGEAGMKAGDDATISKTSFQSLTFLVCSVSKYPKGFTSSLLTFLFSYNGRAKNFLAASSIFRRDSEGIPWLMTWKKPRFLDASAIWETWLEALAEERSMSGMPSASITTSLGPCWVSWMKAGSTSPMAVVVIRT